MIIILQARTHDNNYYAHSFVHLIIYNLVDFERGSLLRWAMTDSSVVTFSYRSGTLVFDFELTSFRSFTSVPSGNNTRLPRTSWPDSPNTTHKARQNEDREHLACAAGRGVRLRACVSARGRATPRVCAFVCTRVRTCARMRA